MFVAVHFCLFLQKKCCCKEKTRSTTLCNASVADAAAAFLCWDLGLCFLMGRLPVSAACIWQQMPFSADLIGDRVCFVFVCFKGKNITIDASGRVRVIKSNLRFITDLKGGGGTGQKKDCGKSGCRN